MKVSPPDFFVGRSWLKFSVWNRLKLTRAGEWDILHLKVKYIGRSLRKFGHWRSKTKNLLHNSQSLRLFSSQKKMFRIVVIVFNPDTAKSCLLLNWWSYWLLPEFMKIYLNVNKFFRWMYVIKSKTFSLTFGTIPAVME